MVHEGGELVVQQVVVQGLAGLVVELQLLAEAVADGHGHAAVDLGLRQRRVDEGPQSWTFTMFSSFTLHMGMSTSTSAKEQPKE